MDEQDTFRRIKKAITEGQIPRTFKPAAVDVALGIKRAGVFLPKHRAGNPGSETELFVRVGRGVNRLK